MEPSNVVILEFKELVAMTNNFSEENCIGRFQYGKLYHTNPGVEYYGIVKIWEVPEIYHYQPFDNELRQMDEIILLRHEMWNHYPGMLEMYGYCREGEHLGALFLLKSRPLDSVFNLIPKNDYSWQQRIKSALGLAYLLKILHGEHSSFYTPFRVNNLDAAHLVVDEEYNIKLCDFGWITGGIFPERRSCSGHDIIGCYGYIDIGSSSEADFSDRRDVFAFGVILLSLISKRVYSEEDRLAGTPFVYEWARREYEAFEFKSEMKDTELSLVHDNLTVEDGFCGVDGYKITKMALECVNRVKSQRPNMEQVHRLLQELKVVKQHTKFFGAVMELPPCEVEIDMELDPCEVEVDTELPPSSMSKHGVDMELQPCEASVSKHTTALL